MTAAAPWTDPGAAASPSEGWQADPWQRHGLRYYDGRLWTEHVADGGVASVDSSPVAHLERSRPAPVRAAPPGDPVGARVVRVGPGPVPDAETLLTTEAGALLLLAPPDAVGDRDLWTPDDRLAGRVIAPRPRPLTRLGRRLVAAPSTAVTRLSVRHPAGGEVVRISRPRRRTAPVVDVVGPAGPLGTVTADRVVQEVRGQVVAADGRVVGELARARGVTAARAVTDGEGRLRARLTPVWDVPGDRRHLPPGVLLLDRRPPPGESWDPVVAALVLGAVLAPALLERGDGTLRPAGHRGPGGRHPGPGRGSDAPR